MHQLPTRLPAAQSNLRRAVPMLNLLLMAALLCLAPALLSRAQEAAPAASGGGAPVAQLNDVVLTEAEFLRRCERVVGGQSDTAVGWVAIKDWFQQALAEQEAVKRKVVPDDKAIERRVFALRKQWEFRGVNFHDWLAERGRSMETLKADVRTQLLAENLMTEGIEVNPSEAAVAYQSNKAAFGLPERIRISRITAPNREVQSKVEAGLKKGTEFDIVAREHSADPYALSGGQVLDPIDITPGAQGQLEPEVMAQVLKLQPKKVAGPIKVDTYWVWVRLDEKLPARYPPLADVEDLMTANLKMQKAGPKKLEEAQQRLVALQKGAKMQVFRPEYRSVLNLLQPKDPAAAPAKDPAKEPKP